VEGLSNHRNCINIEYCYLLRYIFLILNCHSILTSTSWINHFREHYKASQQKLGGCWPNHAIIWHMTTPLTVMLELVGAESIHLVRTMFPLPWAPSCCWLSEKLSLFSHVFSRSSSQTLIHGTCTYCIQYRNFGSNCDIIHSYNVPESRQSACLFF